MSHFDQYYAAAFGSRWPGLKAALQAENEKIPFDTGYGQPYFMDGASIHAASCLRLPDRDASPDSATVLDACAAPGGKTLVLARAMGPTTTLLANELSSERRRRLSDVLDAHLEPSVRARVRVCGFDAAAAGARLSERDRFAAILLDAPCSSERHVLADPKALAQWSPARIRFLAQRQWALLSSAFVMLADGGSLVYATCALSDEENDGPVARLFKKYGDRARLDPIEPEPGQEISLYGVRTLPDRAGGLGPLYVCRIRKAPAD